MPSPARPVRLTVSPVEPGYAKIRADGIQVGYALTVWDGRDVQRGAWEAHLWPVAGVHEAGGVTVKRLRLHELRAELRRRLDEGGPWWSETAATGCPVVFVPADPEYCPRCTCDQPPAHRGHHHCPDCGIWYTLASDVERAS